MNTEVDGGYCLICYQCIYFQHYHLNYLIGYLENKIKFIDNNERGVLYNQKSNEDFNVSA